MSAQREHFSSRIGFILAAAGSAVGIGNLVGFPVNAAKNGGGAFLVMYAIFVFLICLPVMMAEMAAGRRAAKDPVGVYKLLSNNHKGWSFAGLLSVITPFMIAVFYTVLTIWILGYLMMTMLGQLDQLAKPTAFEEFLTSPYLFIYMLLVGAIVFFILVAGVKEGIEKAAKILMPSLFILLIGLVIFVLTLDNAFAGIEYYLVPDMSKLTPSVINGALSQAFFSLSLGMGILITYGSYIDNHTNIGNSAKMVALTDTAVAFIAGLMILPAVFSFNPNINTDELSTSSVSMIFVFLPKIFLALQASLGYFGASFIACIFFILVFFAAITSLVSIIEVPVSYLMSEKCHSRKKALSTVLLAGGVLSVLTALSTGMVSFLTKFVSYAGADKSLFDVIYDIFYDTILPLNGLLICLFVVYRWKRENLSAELAVGNEGYRGSFVEKYVNVAISTFIPLILLSIFVNTILQKYFAIELF